MQSANCGTSLKKRRDPRTNFTYQRFKKAMGVLVAAEKLLPEQRFVTVVAIKF